MAADLLAPLVEDSERAQRARARQAERAQRARARQAERAPAPDFVLKGPGCGACSGWAKKTTVLGRCKTGRFKGTLTSFAALCPDYFTTPKG